MGKKAAGGAAAYFGLVVANVEMKCKFACLFRGSCIGTSERLRRSRTFYNGLDSAARRARAWAVAAREASEPS